MVQKGGRRLDAKIELLRPSITYIGGEIGISSSIDGILAYYFSATDETT